MQARSMCLRTSSRRVNWVWSGKLIELIVEGWRVEREEGETVIVKGVCV